MAFGTQNTVDGSRMGLAVGEGNKVTGVISVCGYGYLLSVMGICNWDSWWCSDLTTLQNIVFSDCIVWGVIGRFY